jgi:hypothetical protein
MPRRMVAAMIGDSEWSAITDSRLSGRLTRASGLGAQTEASGQFGAGDSVGATVLWGAAPRSGISHSGWAALSLKLRHTAVPRRGCSWINRSRAARTAFMARTLFLAPLRSKARPATRLRPSRVERGEVFSW